VSRRAVELLADELGEAFTMLRGRIDGLTDEEFAWEPAPGAWTVRPDERGMWIADYAEPDPVPAPITTIGWRVVHVSDCKLMYREYAFGPGRLQWPELEAPHAAGAALAALDEHQAALMTEIDGLADDSALDEERMTNWGEQWPTWRILWTMVHHDLWHGGEIGAMRDVYRITVGG
jgi:DinB superfamily